MKEGQGQGELDMMDFLYTIYPWIKALHIMAVIAWMAGLFYLPRLYVYHAERAKVGSELDQTFQIMEEKLLRLIMNPSMIVAWAAGLIMLGLGAFDWGAAWSWIKIASVLAMTWAHMWMAARRKEFAAGTNTRTGRQYRIFNEVPTVLMLLIVIAVIVRPF
jgi:putative membrane protein